MGKIVKMSFEGKNLKEMGKWTEKNFFFFEKKLDPRGWSAPGLGQYEGRSESSKNCLIIQLIFIVIQKETYLI